MHDRYLYIEIYLEISKKLESLLGNYVHDEDKSYEAAMSLLMISMKMFMFSGLERDDLPKLYMNIEETFDNVYKDFKRVDLNMKD